METINGKKYNLETVIVLEKEDKERKTKTLSRNKCRAILGGCKTSSSIKHIAYDNVQNK